MSKRCRKKDTKRAQDLKSDLVSYHLKCTKAGNGLSHFVMYGDVPKDKAVL